MAVVFVRHAQLRALAAFLEGATFYAKLFRNDRIPKQTDTAAQYQEADFSGYQGQQPITAWTDPVMVDGRAYSRADSLTWQHSGGPEDNLIFGYFVVDEDGALLWAERNPAGPRIVSAGNPDYVVTPVVTETSEF